MNTDVLTSAGLSTACVALAYITYQLCSVVMTHPWRCRSRCCGSTDDTVLEYSEPTPPELRRALLADFFEQENYSV